MFQTSGVLDVLFPSETRSQHPPYRPASLQLGLKEPWKAPALLDKCAHLGHRAFCGPAGLTSRQTWFARAQDLESSSHFDPAPSQNGAQLLCEQRVPHVPQTTNSLNLIQIK